MPLHGLNDSRPLKAICRHPRSDSRRHPINDIRRVLRTLMESASTGWPAQHRVGYQRLVSNTAIAAALGMLLVMAIPAVRGHVYVRDDLGAYHLPLRCFYARQLAAGEAFDWHPGLFGGFYLTGEGQVGTYHPWHLFLYGCLPLPIAFAVELLSAYAVLWGGTLVLMQRLTQDRAAAAWAALAFAFGGFPLLRFVHPNAVAVVAHIPWLLWIEDRLITLATPASPGIRAAAASHRARAAGATRLRWWLAYAILSGSQLLLGYPQYVWYSLLAEFAWLLVRGSHRICKSSIHHVPGAGRDWLASVPLLILAKLGGLALGAVQFLPTWDALRESTRAAPSAVFQASGSLHPANVVQLLAPYLFRDRVLGGITHEMALYIGAVPLCLAVIAWTIALQSVRGSVMRRRERSRSRSSRGDLQPVRSDAMRPVLVASAVGAVLALLAAFGQYAPLFSIHRLLPFRCPSRAIVLFQLCVVMAAACGFRQLLRLSLGWGTQQALRSRTVQRVAIAIAAGSIGVAAFRIGFGDGISLPWAAPAAAVWGPVLFVASALGIAAAARGYRAALLGLVLLTACDMAGYGLTYAVWADTLPWSDWRAQAAIPPLQNATERPFSGRIMYLPKVAPSPASLPAVGNPCLVQGVRRMDGYAGLPPRRILDMRDPTARRIAGVEWVGWFSPDSRGTLRLAWEQCPRPLPRFRTVGRCIVSPPAPEVIARLEPDRAAITDERLAIDPDAKAAVEVLKDQPGRLAVMVTTDGPVLLAISEAYHRGWRARLDDGDETPVLRVNGDLLGCVIPSGRHSITLTFRPWNLVWGQRISLAAFTLVIGGCFLTLSPWGLPGARRRPPKRLD